MNGLLSVSVVFFYRGRLKLKLFLWSCVTLPALFNHSSAAVEYLLIKRVSHSIDSELSSWVRSQSVHSIDLTGWFTQLSPLVAMSMMLVSFVWGDHEKFLLPPQNNEVEWNSIYGAHSVENNIYRIQQDDADAKLNQNKTEKCGHIYEHMSCCIMKWTVSLSFYKLPHLCNLDRLCLLILDVKKNSQLYWNWVQDLNISEFADTKCLYPNRYCAHCCSLTCV